jgi:predicted TIM-barrel fold metal-dependent hydrolase
VPGERVDVHQHLWPEALLAALAARRSTPRLRRLGEGWTLCLDGEPDCRIEAVDHDPEARATLVRADGLDRALISLSSPMGLESLPHREAAPLLEAYHDGVASLPPVFGCWAAAALDGPDVAALEERLDAGFVGLQLPAAALVDAAGYARCAPLLDALERRSRPLLVHPGPAPWAPNAPSPTDTPLWWPALTDYVAQMSTAWHAFLQWGRPRHPALRVAFVMLAGLGPLHGERLRARGGAHRAIDSGMFLESSSYGTTALDAALRVVGVDQLLHGSDRPVVDPPGHPLGTAVAEAMLVRNPARLLTPVPLEVPA